MAVSDLRDTRTLIPRVRRALEGAGVVSPTLTDDAVNAIIADAIANVILMTGGLWGHELQVAERDATYMAPTAWLIDPALSEAEGSLIAIQAQLDYLYQDLKVTKVQETIRDESSEWSYSLSASTLVELLRGLRKQRDAAIAAINDNSAGMEAWVNTLYERDAWTDYLIEPRVVPGGVGGQLFVDTRFE